MKMNMRVKREVNSVAIQWQFRGLLVSLGFKKGIIDNNRFGVMKHHPHQGVPKCFMTWHADGKAFKKHKKITLRDRG
jgi:hypothetical protein